METLSLPDRVEKKIERIPFSGCWIWMGAEADKRYGSLWDGKKVSRAHRVVFQLAGNHLPNDRELLHACDIGFCVNPAHLIVGTHAENMADMARKARSRAPLGDSHWTHQNLERARLVARRNIAKTHAHGESNNNAKITQAIANQIRATYEAEPALSMTELGQRFGIGREQSRKIIKGIVWKS